MKIAIRRFAFVLFILSLGVSCKHETNTIAARIVIDSVIALALIVAAFIDFKHMYLPDPITIGGTVLAIATAGLRPEIGWLWSPIFALVGFVGIWAPFIVGYKILRGQPGMGLGDAKLMALFGAWLGWRAMLFTIFAASLQGVVGVLILLVYGGQLKEPASVTAEREAALEAGTPLDPANDLLALPPEPGFGKVRIPFGPFLILSALEFLFFQHTLLEPFLAMLGTQ